MIAPPNLHGLFWTETYILLKNTRIFLQKTDS